MNDLRILRRLVGYEQRTFWRRPASVVFTFVFPVALLVFFGSVVGPSVDGIGASRFQVLVPAMAAFAVQGACFNDLAIGVVTRRQSGLLKRLRLTPVPAWAVLGGTVVSAALVGILLAGVALSTGRLLFDLRVPAHAVLWGPVLLAGIFCFTALGLAAASLLTNAEAAAPIVTISYLAMNFLSGAFVPIDSASWIGRVAEVLPSRHFLRGSVAAFLPQVDVAEVVRSVAVLVVWGAVAALIASKRFRWTPRKA